MPPSTSPADSRPSGSAAPSRSGRSSRTSPTRRIKNTTATAPGEDGIDEGEREALALAPTRRPARSRVHHLACSCVSGKRDIATETERVRRLQDREAPRYDKQIAFFERLLF